MFFYLLLFLIGCGVELQNKDCSAVFFLLFLSLLYCNLNGEFLYPSHHNCLLVHMKFLFPLNFSDTLKLFKKLLYIINFVLESIAEVFSDMRLYVCKSCRFSRFERKVVSKEATRSSFCGGKSDFGLDELKSEIGRAHV